MRTILLAFLFTFSGFISQAQAREDFDPRNCRIGSWVIIMNIDKQSSADDILKAKEVIDRARDVMTVVRRTPYNDGSITLNLDRNPKLPDTPRGRALESRAVENIIASFKALQGMDFYCYL